jgi:thiol-disulfide isomerase/thioredoxin
MHRNTEKYTWFRCLIGVCISCIFVSLTMYASLQSLFMVSPGTNDSSSLVNGIFKSSTGHGLYGSSAYVMELNAHSYDLVSKGSVPAIILYYASWCGHCK